MGSNAAIFNYYISIYSVEYRDIGRLTHDIPYGWEQDNWFVGEHRYKQIQLL